MFLRHKICRKDGKEHRYWSIVENRRVSGGRTVQRHVLYLGEINDSQRAAWCQTIEAFDETGQNGKQIALFPEDRAPPALDCDVVHVRLSGLRLRNPRQWGACWLACHLWDELQLKRVLVALPARLATGDTLVERAEDAGRLQVDRSGQRVAAALAMVSNAVPWAICGATEFDLGQKDNLYRCLDQLLVHKTALFSFLQQRWRTLFEAKFEVLLYDLTSTYFECDPP